MIVLRVLLGFLCLGLYWLIGVGISVLDVALREKMQHHHRWNLKPPTDINPVKVTVGWAVYVPCMLLWSTYWLFTTGTIVMHRLLLEKLGIK